MVEGDVVMCCYEYPDEDVYGIRYELLGDGSLIVDSEPMEDYNWEEWLEIPEDLSDDLPYFNRNE